MSKSHGDTDKAVNVVHYDISEDMKLRAIEFTIA